MRQVVTMNQRVRDRTLTTRYCVRKGDLELGGTFRVDLFSRILSNSLLLHTFSIRECKVGGLRVQRRRHFQKTEGTTKIPTFFTSQRLEIFNWTG